MPNENNRSPVTVSASQIAYEDSLKNRRALFAISTILLTGVAIFLCACVVYSSLIWLMGLLSQT